MPNNFSNVVESPRMEPVNAENNVLNFESLSYRGPGIA
jgi:hypothetical protein